MKQIFLDLRDIILNIYDQKQNQIIKYFDLWNRQLEFLAEDSPADYPAVYLELLPIQWEDLSHGIQQGELEFKLHIVTPWFGQTYSNAPAEVSSEQLDYLNLPTIIFKTLQTATITNCNSITRTATEFDHNHEKLIETIESYKCLTIDSSAYQHPAILNLIPETTIE